VANSVLKCIPRTTPGFIQLCSEAAH